MLRIFYRNHRSRWLKSWNALYEQTVHLKQCESLQSEHRLPIPAKNALEVKTFFGHDGFHRTRYFSGPWLNSHYGFWERLGLGATILLGIKLGFLKTKFKCLRDKKSKKLGDEGDYPTIYSVVDASSPILESTPSKDLWINFVGDEIISKWIISQDSQFPTCEEVIRPGAVEVIDTYVELPGSIFGMNSELGKDCYEVYESDPSLSGELVASASLDHQSVTFESVESIGSDAPELILVENVPEQDFFESTENVSLSKLFHFDLLSSLLRRDSCVLPPFFDLCSSQYVAQTTDKNTFIDAGCCFQEICEDDLLNLHQFRLIEASCMNIFDVLNQALPKADPISEKVEEESSPERDDNFNVKEVDIFEQCLKKIFDDLVVEEKCDIAAKMARKGEYNNAIQIWKGIISKHLLHAKSLYNLATCFENGLGVRKDIEKAKELYEKAAELNHPRSCYRLARIFLKEWRCGDKTSLEKCQMHLSKAAKLGFEKAEDELQDVMREAEASKKDCHTKKKTPKKKASVLSSSKKSGHRRSAWAANTDTFLEELETQRMFIHGNNFMHNEGNLLSCH